MTDSAGDSLICEEAAGRMNGAAWKVAAFVCSVLFLLGLPSFLHAQVSSAEIKNPQLKALEQAYFSQLLALNQAISETKFPFKFSLNRYVGLDPKDQVGADTRGLEFVKFRDRELLKFSGNYNAAFNADGLTPNQRAGRVLNEVILPMLKLLPNHFDERATFDAFGFEIGYHVRRHTASYEYEGKEALVVVFDKTDGLLYGSLPEDRRRQEILNASEIYLNGEPFGLALNMEAPFDVETLVRRPAAKTGAAAQQSAIPAANKNKEAMPKPEVSAQAQNIPAKIDLDALQKKYVVELESLRQEGIAKYHFVDYAPLSFVVFKDQAALQATLRNPEAFDKDSSSIYRRAARTFDMFLAPHLKWIMEKVPDSPDFHALDLTVVLDLTSSNTPKSSEAIEFVLPLKSTRRFVAADITSQDLINDSVVLVNGVRISLNLAQVE